MQHQLSVNKQTISVQTTHTHAHAALHSETPSCQSFNKPHPLVAKPVSSIPLRQLVQQSWASYNQFPIAQCFSLIILTSSRSSKWSLSKRFPNKFLYAFLISSQCPPQTCKISLCQQFWHCPHYATPSQLLTVFSGHLVTALGIATPAQTSHESKPSFVPQGYVEFLTLGHVEGSNRCGLTVYPSQSGRYRAEGYMALG